MNTRHNKNNTVGVASNQLIKAVWDEIPNGFAKLTGHAKHLSESVPTDWTQTGNVTVLNANGSLDINPKSLITSTSTNNY